MYNWQLYLGCETAQAPKTVGIAHKVVSLLTGNIQNKGHLIYMDLFFSFPALFHHLAQHGKGAYGTLLVDQKGLPNEMAAAKI